MTANSHIILYPRANPAGATFYIIIIDMPFLSLLEEVAEVISLLSLVLALLHYILGGAKLKLFGYQLPSVGHMSCFLFILDIPVYTCIYLYIQHL